MNKYVEELKAKSVTELNEELVAAKKELFKNIARIQTVMTEKARLA